MPLLLRIAVVLVLAWQAGSAAWAMLEPVVATDLGSWRQRLFATSDERVRRALGADAEILFAMRAAAEPGALWLVEKVAGRIEDIKTPADFERLSARNGLLIQLSTLLYPDPFLLAAPAAIAATEDLIGRGFDAALCVLPGDAAPAGRAGWRLVLDDAHFDLWRFRQE